MFNRLLALAGVAGVLALSACASEPEPVRAVYPEPVFDKYGRGSGGGGDCPVGYGRGGNDITGGASSQSGDDPCCPSGYGGSPNDPTLCIPIPQQQRQPGSGEQDQPRGGNTPGSTNG